MYMIIRQMVQSLRFLCGFVFQFASENTRILITSSAHKENVLRELECSVVEWTGSERAGISHSIPSATGAALDDNLRPGLTGVELASYNLPQS